MTTAENPTAGASHIAGFWRRLFAFILDVLVLGVFGACLGLVSYDYLASVGGWGRIIGFFIALTYLGVMNSRIFGGQTVGKMVMKIKVVSSNGAPLNVAASFCRSGILCVPYFLNGAPFDVDLLRSWFVVVLTLLVFGVGLSVVYLFIFNRRTRQSLHDLAVGSYVVKTGAETVPQLFGAPWRGHFAVVAVIMILAGAAPIFTGRLAQTEPFTSLLLLQKALASEPGIRHVTVQVGTSSVASVQKGTQSTTNLSAQVITESKDLDREALANKIAQIALSSYAEASKKDSIAVSLAYGYDIGIASAWQSQNFAYSPAQWRGRLTPKSSSLPPTDASNAPAPEAGR